MKVLILSPRTPCAKGKADSMNVYYLIQYLHEKGHRIHLITCTPQISYEWDNMNELEIYCESIDLIPLSKIASNLKVVRHIFDEKPLQVHYYYYKSFEEQVHKVIDRFKPDCIYAHLIRMAEYLKNVDTPKLLGMLNGQSLNYGRLVEHDKNVFRRFMYFIEYRKVKKYEPYIAKQFDKVTLISKYDQLAIDPDNELDNVHLCPCGIDFDYYSTDLGLDKKPFLMVMNGDFGTPTNIHAAAYFMDEIYPLVKAKVKQCSMVFAGRDSDTNLKAFANEHVTLTGRVDDIRPYLQSADIAVNPIKIAAGQQNKTLVSMAAGLPVVSTSIANEGIQAKDNKEILLADTPQQFADKIVQLMSDTTQKKRIINGGFQFVKNNWNLHIHHEKLERILISICKRQRKSPPTPRIRVAVK